MYGTTVSASHVLELQAGTSMLGYMLVCHLKPYLDHWTREQFIFKEVIVPGNDRVGKVLLPKVENLSLAETTYKKRDR